MFTVSACQNCHVISSECHHNLLQFELGSGAVSLAYVFARLEEAQADLDIEDYSVNQNTLDNVCQSEHDR